MSETIARLLRHALDLRAEGRDTVACLLVHARGSTPQAAGALMLVDDAMNTAGTIGGGCVEAEVRRRAMEMMSRGEYGLLRFKLDHDYGWDDGLICGGTVEFVVAPLPETPHLQRVLEEIAARRPVTLELRASDGAGESLYHLNIPPRDRLYIAGAGHVGQALARLAITLDFEVTLFDDRADLLERLAPDGAQRRSGPIAEQLNQAEIDDRTHCVIVTRGHRHDEQALAAVVNRGARYVGMIGSRRKVKLIFDDLREQGVDEDALGCVHAPIGLDINAVSVEEIAVSIAAELVQVRRAERCAAVEVRGGKVTR